MKELLNIFKALSEETRLRIINLLRNGELCVCDIVAALDLIQPKISFHLNVLKEAKLIKDRKQGRWIYYRHDDSDMYRRFLLMSVIERISADTVSEDNKRLTAFQRTKTEKGKVISLDAACKSCVR